MHPPLLQATDISCTSLSHTRTHTQSHIHSIFPPTHTHNHTFAPYFLSHTHSTLTHTHHTHTAFFSCYVCHTAKSVEIDRGRIAEPAVCSNCQTLHSMALIHNRSLFTDKQMVKLQESPDDMPPGQTPHTVLLYAHHDLVDSVQPGDRWAGLIDFIFNVCWSTQYYSLFIGR